MRSSNNRNKSHSKVNDSSNRNKQCLLHVFSQYTPLKTSNIGMCMAEMSKCK